MLYTVFPICGYTDCYLILFQDLLISKKIHYKALRCLQVTFDSVEYTWKVCFTTVSKSSQVYNRLQTSPYIEGCLVHVVIKSQWIVQSLVHTLSCMPIRSFPLQDVSFSLPDQSNDGDIGMGWNVGWIFNGNIHPFSKLRKQQSGRYWKRTTPNSSENWKINDLRIRPRIQEEIYKLFPVKP